MQEASHSIDLAALVDEHHASIYRYAYRLCGCAADAEDLCQQTFLAAQRKVSQLRDANCAAGWLFTILRNCFFKTRRRQFPLSATRIGFDLDSVPDDVPPNAGFDQERLQASLNELPDEFRVVVCMYFFEDCSYREISEKLDIPMGTVMSRLWRAKKHLRASLADAEMVSLPVRAQGGTS